ncbi:SDR family NAD(P)-dependent oxidoreductase [Cupriavidus basilensis]
MLVTGGNSGIGLASAQAFAAEGARVIVTGRDAATLEAAKPTLGANALAIQNEAGTVAAARALAQRQRLTDEGIRLDALFINAGIARSSRPVRSRGSHVGPGYTQYRRVHFFQIQALMPLFNNGASIVLNGAINAHIGMPASSVYAASKAGIISLAKTTSPPNCCHAAYAST